MKQTNLEMEKILHELLKFNEKYNISNKDKNINIIKEEMNKLENNEFTISIIGTMKAGKSTFINALIGKEVLPHRDTPMTTIPTKVSHKHGNKNPILKINDFNYLNDLIEQLEKKSNPKKKFEKIKNQYKGNKEIFEILQYINDIFREAQLNQIDIDWQRYKQSEKLPTIEVEFFLLQGNNNVNFSLIDTPGPNENNMDQLKELSESYTNNSSAVMLVIDYTKMNGKEGEELKIQLKEALGLIKNENVFLIVNKFDEYKKSNSQFKNEDDLKQFIIKNFLDNRKNIKNEQIFPISARDAFYANWGLNNLDKLLEMQENEILNIFIENIIGNKRTWNKIKNDISEIKEYCEDAKKESKFDNVQKLLINLFNESNDKILEVSITKAEEIFNKTKQHLDEEIKNYEKNQEQLADEIKKTKLEIKNLEKVFKQLKKNLEKEIKNKIKFLNNDIEELQEKTIKEILRKLGKTDEENDENNTIIEKTLSDKEAAEQFLEILKFQISDLVKKNINNFDEEKITSIVNELKRNINDSEQYKKINETLEKLKDFDIKINFKNNNFLFDIENLIDVKYELSYRYVDKDGLFASFLRAVGSVFGQDDWGKHKIKEEKHIIEFTKNDLEELRKRIKKLLENHINERMKSLKDEINNILKYIEDEINRYVKNKEEVLKQKQGKSEEEIQSNIKNLKEEKEYLNKLKKRVEVIKGIK